MYSAGRFDNAEEPLVPIALGNVLVVRSNF
jgi:hypothetical protein